MAIQLVSGMKLVGFATNSILKVDTNGILTTAVDGVDYNTSTSQWTNTNGGIYYSDSVRVGTYQAGVLPGAKLHVFDYQTTTPKFLIEDGNTGDASMEFKISTQSYTMGIDNSDSDKFVLAASTALGTTNVLEVSTTGNPAFQTDTLFNKQVYFQDNIFFNANGKSFRFDHDGTRDLYQVTHNGVTKMYLRAVGEDDLQWEDINQDPILKLTQERDAYFYGNVGIGTTEPSRKLHVNSGTTNHVAIFESTDSTAYIQLKDSGAYSNVVSADGSLILEADQGQNLANSNIRFSIDASEKMRLLNSGNLGIDRTNPLFKLHVYHPTTNVTAQFESGDNQAWISVRDSGYTTYGAMLGCDFANGQSIILADNGATKRLIINESGNLQLPAYTAGLLKTDANGNVSLDTNTYALSSHTHTGLSGTSNDTIVINSSLQVDQGSEDALISFQQSGTEIGKFDQDGYLYATGFKTSTASTGFLKADGSIDTSTYASSSHNHNSLYVAIAGGYYDSDFTWDGTHDFSNVIKVSGASATTTNTTALFYGTGGLVEKRTLGTAAFSASTDFASASHNHNKIVENGLISYGQGSLQWLDVSGNGGTGYAGSSPENPFNDWHHHIVMNHANSTGYYVDMAFSFHNDRVHFRRKAGGGDANLSSWKEFWHTGNLSKSEFATASHNHTDIHAGHGYINSGDWNDLIATHSSDPSMGGGIYRVESSTTSPPASGVYNWSLYQQGTALRGSQLALSAYGSGNRMFFRGANVNTGVYRDWAEVWHSDNFNPADKANASHTHSAADITSGTLDNARLSTSVWRSGINNSWTPSSNILLGQTGNNQEWSFDITRNGYTGGYWQVWDSSNSTMLKG